MKFFNSLPMIITNNQLNNVFVWKFCQNAIMPNSHFSSNLFQIAFKLKTYYDKQQLCTTDLCQIADKVEIWLLSSFKHLHKINRTALKVHMRMLTSCHGCQIFYFHSLTRYSKVNKEKNYRLDVSITFFFLIS